jgi:hypothetical protein
MRITVPVTLALSLWLGAAAARSAHAGYCEEGDDVKAVEDVERYAKHGGKQPESVGLCIDDAWDQPKLQARMLKACEAILAREPGFASCLDWAAKVGLKTHGGVDVYDAISKARSLDPFGDTRPTLRLYVSLGEPRAVAPVLAAWKAALADPRVKQYSHWWPRFQISAVELFERVGGADERAFLTEQMAVIKARSLKKRMKKAVAAIDQRLARTP